MSVVVPVFAQDIKTQNKSICAMHSVYGLLKTWVWRKNKQTLVTHQQSLANNSASSSCIIVNKKLHWMDLQMLKGHLSTRKNLPP